MVRPSFRIVKPIPPPSVSPARPVCEMNPAGTANPKAWVSRSSSPNEHAGLGANRSCFGIDADALHQGKVDDHAAVAHAVAGVAVAAAAHRDEKLVRAGKAHRLDHVRDAGAARDQRRVPVDRGVPHPPTLVVAVVAGPNELTAEG